MLGNRLALAGLLFLVVIADARGACREKFERLAATFKDQVELFDAVRGEGPSLTDAIQKLGDENRVAVVAREARWPWSREVQSAVKWGGWPLLRRPSRLTFYLPKRSPRSFGEVGEQLLAIAKGVRDAQLATERWRSPLFSLPVGKSSFPKKLVDKLERSAQREYGFVHRWNESYPESAIALPKRGPRPLSLPFTIARGALVALYPKYDAIAGYRLNEADFTKWREGGRALHDHLFAGYGNRARLTYLAATLRRILIASAVANVGMGATTAARFYFSPERRIAEEQMTEMYETINNPEKSDAILKEYKERPGGSPAVNDYFDKENDRLRELIRANGDPDGKLAQEIKDNEELRDALKN